MTVLTLKQRLLQLQAELAALPHAECELEAQVLICRVLDRPRSHLFTWPDQPFDPKLEAPLQELLSRRLAGEPVAHILGQREFWSLPLKVSADTLIPRPETELLVELALQRIPTGQPLRVLDLGTGSGAIALAIASERPGARITATDRSAQALELARCNARELGLEQVEFRQGDWFTALPSAECFDLILSNPPYIADLDPHLQQGDLPREPLSALVSGSDGLDDIRRITEEAINWLQPQGWLLFEHGYQQAHAVCQILARGGLANPTSWNDLAGNPRVSGGQLPGSGGK